ncbi:hypothetical protein M9458_055791 [Cirrhinus mrigala]|uniref:Retrotransposon gag domain-containing protein n=1 Tax=Cirrhinus mrigala TaxID=683832 RepID=A0ABD0MIY2_CIRMR
MYLSRPLNKSSQMDPLASRLSLSITEQSVTTGPSSFLPGHSHDMDTDRILCRIKQGPHTLDQYIREFLSISNYSTLPDCLKIEIFCDGVNEHLKAKLRRVGPRLSLEAFMNFALLCVGSPFSVGVAERERDNAVMATARPTRRLAVMPEHDPTNTFSAWIAREMAAVSERAHAMVASAEPVRKMAAKAGLHHATAALPKPYQVAAVFPESSQVRTVVPVSSQIRAAASVSSQITAIFPEPSTDKMAATPEPVAKMAVTPEPLHKMAVTPEPVHKMAAIPKPVHKMAAVSKPYHKMAAILEPSASTWTPPVVMMAHVLDSPLRTVWAAKVALLHTAAATPGSSQASKSGQNTESSEDTESS